MSRNGETPEGALRLNHANITLRYTPKEVISGMHITITLRSS